MALSNQEMEEQVINKIVLSSQDMEKQVNNKVVLFLNQDSVDLGKQQVGFGPQLLYGGVGKQQGAFGPQPRFSGPGKQ